MVLEPREPFDFARTLRFILSPPALLNGRAFAPLVDYWESGEYRRVAEIEGRPVLYGVAEAQSRQPRTLRIRILAGPNSARARQAVRRVVNRQFSGDLDLNPFYAVAARDRVLRKLTARFRGTRIPQAPSIFESVVCAVLEQQVNLTFAHQVKRALVETYGDAIEFEGRRYFAFPEPKKLAALTPEELRPLQISGPKARYIIGFSGTVSSGEFDLEALRSLPEEEVRVRLLEHKGVGPWTAEYVGLRALGNLDRLPASDVGLQKSIQYFYRLRQTPDAARVEKLARRWAGWRSYATFYLWLTYWEDTEWKRSLLEEIYSAKEVA